LSPATRRSRISKLVADSGMPVTRACESRGAPAAALAWHPQPARRGAR
jgi:hypothetical protein